MILIFLKGLIVGLGASIPLGPLGVLCIQKTLSKGRLSGFLTGCGASVSDTLYAVISLLGLFFVDQFVEEHKPIVFIVGGLIIILIGLKIYFSNPVRQIRQKSKKSKHLEDFFEGLAMTITNPGSIFLIFAMFAFVRLNISDIPENLNLSTCLVLWGIFLGSVLWWFILSTAINLFRKKFRLKQLIMLNKITGIIIMVLGIISFAEGLVEIFVK